MKCRELENLSVFLLQHNTTNTGSFSTPTVKVLVQGRYHLSLTSYKVIFHAKKMCNSGYLVILMMHTPPVAALAGSLDIKAFISHQNLNKMRIQNFCKLHLVNFSNYSFGLWEQALFLRLFKWFSVNSPPPSCYVV